MHSLLTVNALSVYIDGTQILHDVSFEVGHRQWIGLVGPNGSGKTTLLRALAGLVSFSGQIQFDGRPLASWQARPLARRLAFLRQSATLAFDFTVLDLVLLGRTPHHGWLQGFSQTDRQRAHEALEQVELGGFADRLVLSLSGGERQRVFLAQALVQEADLLLLDEPTTHLDVHYQFEFLDLVKQLVSQGRTVMAVFHDLEQAARYTDLLIVLDGGQLVEKGTPGDVITEHLLATTFRMKAHVNQSDSSVRIAYERPLPKKNG